MDQLGTILDEFMREENIRRQVDEGRVHEEWSRIVDPPLSDKTSVHKVQNGRLWLTACNPSWAHEASLQRRDIKRRITEYFGYEVIDSIHIRD